jgi:hypothetical protein
MPKTPYQRHAFVLRIWQEEGVPWRGWVQHAGSQEQGYFQSTEELLSFLRDHTAGLLDRGTADEKE